MVVRVNIGPLLSTEASEEGIMRFCQRHKCFPTQIDVKKKFACAQFEYAREAEDAIKKLNGKCLFSFFVSVCLVKEDLRELCIFVGNLSSTVREEDIKRFFAKYNPLKIKLNYKFAFVEFKCERDCQNALFDLDGKRLRDKTVTLELVRDKSRKEYVEYENRLKALAPRDRSRSPRRERREKRRSRSRSRTGDNYEDFNPANFIVLDSVSGD